MGKVIVFGLILAYGFGVWKFWSGFRKTNFTQTLLNRIGLSLSMASFIYR